MSTSGSMYSATDIATLRRMLETTKEKSRFAAVFKPSEQPNNYTVLVLTDNLEAVGATLTLNFEYDGRKQEKTWQLSKPELVENSLRLFVGSVEVCVDRKKPTTLTVSFNTPKLVYVVKGEDILAIPFSSPSTECTDKDITNATIQFMEYDLLKDVTHYIIGNKDFVKTEFTIEWPSIVWESFQIPPEDKDKLHFIRYTLYKGETIVDTRDTAPFYLEKPAVLQQKPSNRNILVRKNKNVDKQK